MTNAEYRKIRNLTHLSHAIALLKEMSWLPSGLRRTKDNIVDDLEELETSLEQSTEDDGALND